MITSCRSSCERPLAAKPNAQLDQSFLRRQLLPYRSSRPSPPRDGERNYLSAPTSASFVQPRNLLRMLLDALLPRLANRRAVDKKCYLSTIERTAFGKLPPQVASPMLLRLPRNCLTSVSRINKNPSLTVPKVHRSVKVALGALTGSCGPLNPGVKHHETA